MYKYYFIIINLVRNYSILWSDVVEPQKLFHLLGYQVEKYRFRERSVTV